jgi:hypothetical protein
MYSEARRPTRRLSAVPARSRATLALLLVAVIGLPLAACGKKGDPLPPLRTTPAAATDLSVRQQGRLLFFDVAYPATTVSGTALDGVEAIELFVMTKPLPAGRKDTDPWPTAEPAEFEAAAKSLLKLSGSDLGAAVAGDRVQFELPLASPLPSPPVASIYAVRAIKGDEQSTLSNRVTMVASEPVAPPRDLDAQAQADGVLITWSSDASAAQGYDVFRREAQSRGYGGAIGRVPGTETRYLDRSARFGSRYIYTVRTVANALPLVHSDPAGEREVTYEDRYAPAPPTELLALAERGSVRLRWQASPANDVKGYFLWRRDPAKGPATAKPARSRKAVAPPARPSDAWTRSEP